jgi:hypothetical protein
MLITSGGNVGIGTSSPNNLLTLKASTVAPVLEINRSGGGQGKNSGILFKDQSNNEVCAIGTEGQATNDLQLLSGQGIAFYTSSNLISTGERMRITSGGVLLFGTTANTTGRLGSINIQSNGEFYSKGSFGGYFWEDRSNSANWGGLYMTSNTYFYFNGSANIASISSSTGVYTPLSDINKKKDFEQSKIGLDAILGLKPTLYRIKSDETEGSKELGFIAQEVKEFIPQAYVESGEDENKFIGLNYNAIVAALVKSVQELKAELDELKNK